MAIDYVIDYPCIPKQTLGTEGIVERVKGRDRANAIIQLLREQGDERMVSEMGFEFTRSTPEGTEETRVVMVQDLLDEATGLDSLAQHCTGCPANNTGEPFGCIGTIHYPLSRAGESWLLNQLPGPDEPLIWLLLRQGVQDFRYDGGDAELMRQEGLPYFEASRVMTRQLGEFSVNTNQVFEMIFLLGHIQPPHAGVLLLFFNAIRRDLEANQIMKISPAPDDAAQRFPFLLKPDLADNQTISELKRFFHALYRAWCLNVRLLLDV